MSGPPVTCKWQRATTLQVKRKKNDGWVPMPQLYREISRGYEHFLAKKMKRDTLGSKRP